MHENDREILNQTFEQLKKKGILNYYQARFISLVTQEIEKSDINCLKPYRDLYDSVADEVASQIVVQFLLRNNLNLTMNTANFEYPDFLKIRDLSILSLLKIQNEDFASSTSNTLHSLLKCWKETKDIVVKSNKQKMRQEIKKNLDRINEIDEKKELVSNKSNKGKNHLNQKSKEEENNNSNKKYEFLSKSNYDLNLHPNYEDDDDFDAQIEKQLLSLSNNSIDPNNDINSKKHPSDDEDEIVTKSNLDLSNINVQQRSVSDPSLNDPSLSPKSSQKKELKKFFQKDNNAKKKKREIVTLIPMRSADLKGFDDAKTAFITKVQKFEYLESSSSSDDFFESDASKHENVQFDIDLDDNGNQNFTNYSKSETKKDKETDSDDFDNF